MKITIPAGTKIHVQKGTKFISLVIKKELNVNVDFQEGQKYYFKLPLMNRTAWVEKGKV